MAKTVTFLQLSEEFGGTKFGPFSGVEIRLGCDPGRSDITLPEALGVSPEHVKVLRQQDDTYIVAPVERTATVYIWRASSNKPKQISAPMAVSSGDGFSLVTPEGPRFYLQSEVPNRANQDDDNVQGPGWNVPQARMPSSKGLIAEIKRRGFATVFRGRFGNMAMRGWTFVKTGQIFSPLYIIGALTVVSGWFFAGGMSCAALSFNSSKNGMATELSDCKDMVGGLSDDGNSGPTVPGLVKSILGDLDWEGTLKNDTELKQAFAQQLQLVFESSQSYAWVYKKKRSPFVDFKKQLERKMPAPAVRTLSYAAAQPGRGTEEDVWKVIPADSAGARVCGRGPLRLTWRQAYNLGMVGMQLDALVPRDIADSNDLEQMALALKATAAEASAPEPEFSNDLIQLAGIQGEDECIFLEGEDTREDPKEIATALAAVIGPKSKGLMKEGSSFWIASRGVKMYTADFKRDYKTIKFVPMKSPSTNLSLSNIPGPQKKYAIEQSAAIIARAVAIPCLAVLDKERQDKSHDHLPGEMPNLGSCAIVKAFVDYGRF